MAEPESQGSKEEDLSTSGAGGGLALAMPSAAFPSGFKAAQEAAIGFTGESTPAGCPLASSAISCSAAAAGVQKALRDVLYSAGERLRRKIVADPAMRRLTPQTDADAPAGHVMAVIPGVSTLAQDGAAGAKLLSVASSAMLEWPTAS